MNKIVFLIALILIGYGVSRLYGQQPPMPVPPLPQSVLERMAARSIGAQNPYTTVVDVRVTNVVTTVYDISFMRAIRISQPQTNGVFVTKTNFMVMDTNVISITTNTSTIKPE